MANRLAQLEAGIIDTTQNRLSALEGSVFAPESTQLPRGVAIGEQQVTPELTPKREAIKPKTDLSIQEPEFITGEPVLDEIPIPEPVRKKIENRQFKGFFDELGRGLVRSSARIGASALESIERAAQVSVFEPGTFSDPGETLREFSEQSNFQPARLPKDAKKGDRIKAFVANAVGEALPFTAAAVGSALLTGNPAAPFATAFVVEGENARQDALKAGASEEQADLEAFIVGTVNGALDSLQVDEILRFSGAGKTSIKAIAKAARDKSAKKIAKETGKLTLELARSSITEGVQEALQETTSVVTPIALDILTDADRPGIEEIQANAVRRIGQSALGGAVVGPILSGGIGLVSDIGEAAPSINTQLISEEVRESQEKAIQQAEEKGLIEPTEEITEEPINRLAEFEEFEFKEPAGVGVEELSVEERAELEKEFKESEAGKKIGEEVEKVVEKGKERREEPVKQADVKIEKKTLTPEQEFKAFKDALPSATETEIVKAMIEDGATPPAEVLERNKELPEVQNIIEKQETRQKAKPVEGKVFTDERLVNIQEKIGEENNLSLLTEDDGKTLVVDFLKKAKNSKKTSKEILDIIEQEATDIGADKITFEANSEAKVRLFKKGGFDVVSTENDITIMEKSLIAPTPKAGVKEAATIPGTEITFDDVKMISPSGKTLVIFNRQGKRVHTIKVRNVGIGEEQVKNFKTLLTEADVKKAKQLTVAKPKKKQPAVKKAVEKQPKRAPSPKQPELKPTKGKAGKTTKKEIIRNLSRAFDVPIRPFATHKERKAAGFFKIREKGIRQRDVRDVSVATHEVGHKIDRDQVPAISKSLVKGADKEMFKLGKELYGKRIPAGGYKSEGVAEFIRLFLTTGEAAEKAPIFHKWFTETFLNANPGIKQKLGSVRNQIDDFRSQTSEQRVKNFVIKKDFKGTIPERIAKFTEGFQTAFVDRFTPLRKSIERAGVNRELLRPTEDPFALATVFSEKSGSKTQQFALQFTTDLAGNNTGPSLKTILKPVARRFEDFEAYMIAARAKLLHEKGINSGLTPSDARNVFDQFDSEEFRTALKGVTDWNHRVLDYMVESGAISKEIVDVIKKENPVYIPFQRSFDEGEIKQIRGGSQGLRQKGTPVKRIKGSGREILPPIEAMIAQTERAISASQKAAIAKSLAKLEENFGGLSKLIERVPAPIKITQFKLDQIRDQLEEQGIILSTDLSKTTGQKGKIEIGPFEELDNLMSVFTGDTEFRGKENIVSLIIDGERQFYEVAPAIYNVLEGVDQFHLPAFMDWIFGKPTRLGRLGATGLNASFGLIRNFIRDAANFTVLSKHAKLGPLSAAIGVGKDIKSKLADLTENFTEEGILKADPDVKLFSALGGEMASQVLRDKNGIKHLSHDILASDGITYTINTFMHPVDALRSLFGLTETGTRVGEFSAALKEGEKRWGKNSADAAFFALNAGQDVTTNFTRSGTIGRQLNQAIMFFNAAIQGPNKMFRAFKERPVSTTLKAIATLTVPAFLLWWRNKDEEWYKSLPIYEKANYIHMKIPGKNTILRVPVPFELGHIFQALPVAALDEMFRENPGEVKEIFKESLKQANPLDWPAVAGPIIDIKSNEDFTGAPIVPRRVEGALPEDRVKPHTTKLIRRIGKSLGQSPAQIEHLVNSYSGGLYGRLSKLIEANDRDGTPSDIPVIGTLFLRDSFAPRRQIETFYNRLELLQQKKQSKKISKTEDIERRIMFKIRGRLSKLWKKLRSAETKKERKELYGIIKEQIKLSNREVKKRQGDSP